MTPKQSRFLIEYMVDCNATQAAIRAGYSARTAAKIGWENLQKPEIRTALSVELERLWDATTMTAAEIKAEASRIGRFSLGRIIHVTDTGEPYVDLSKATPDDMAALASAEIEDFVDRRERDAEGNVLARDVRRVKVRAHDKMAALTFLARVHRLLAARVEVAPCEDFAELMMAAERRSTRSPR